MRVHVYMITYRAKYTFTKLHVHKYGVKKKLHAKTEKSTKAAHHGIF